MSQSWQIDYYQYQQQYDAFRSFVEEKSGVPLTSFSANPFTEVEEGYKYDVYRAGREALEFQSWRRADIGTGKIIASTLKAIEISNNNLVPWPSKYGDESRPHQPLYLAHEGDGQAERIESAIYNLYKTNEDETSFIELIAIFGKTYPLLAYFMFLKDRARYLPIGPTAFDRAFEILGIEYKTTQKCSWENYSEYLAVLGEIKVLLSENLEVEVSLLDAHSFCWILASQMEQANRLADVSDYISLPVTEREAINRSRIGQGLFRKAQIEEWSGCAVTGVTEPRLLIASHIKPWKVSSNEERLHRYNGLLLSPDLDALFDKGYITFGDDCGIIISNRLEMSELEKLGLRADMKLDHVKEQHKAFLAYHRENIFE